MPDPFSQIAENAISDMTGAGAGTTDPFSRIAETAISGAASGGAPQALKFTGTTGRSATNNNPLNLEYRKGSYQDKYNAEMEPVSKSGKQRFAKFPSMQAGYEAGIDQIKLDQKRPGMTLKTFVEKFAPAHENPTAELVKSYAKQLGVDPSTPLSQIPAEKLMIPMMARESSTRIAGDKGILSKIGDWIGPSSAEAAEGPAAGDPFAHIADQAIRGQGGDSVKSTIFGGMQSPAGTLLRPSEEPVQTAEVDPFANIASGKTKEGYAKTGVAGFVNRSMANIANPFLETVKGTIRAIEDMGAKNRPAYINPEEAVYSGKYKGPSGKDVNEVMADYAARAAAVSPENTPRPGTLAAEWLQHRAAPPETLDETGASRGEKIAQLPFKVGGAVAAYAIPSKWMGLSGLFTGEGFGSAFLRNLSVFAPTDLARAYGDHGSITGDDLKHIAVNSALFSAAQYLPGKALPESWMGWKRAVESVGTGTAFLAGSTMAGERDPYLLAADFFTGVGMHVLGTRGEAKAEQLQKDLDAYRKRWEELVKITPEESEKVDKIVEGTAPKMEEAQQATAPVIGDKDAEKIFGGEISNLIETASDKTAALTRLTARLGGRERAERYLELYEKKDAATAIKEFPELAPWATDAQKRAAISPVERDRLTEKYDRAVQEKGIAAADKDLEDGLFFSGLPVHKSLKWLKDKLAPIWYSQMQRHLDRSLPGQGRPDQLAGLVEGWAGKGQFKQDELKWSGLVPWLKEQKGPVTKQQVLDFLKENQVEVRGVQRKEGEAGTQDRWYIAYPDGTTIGGGFLTEEAARADLADAFPGREDEFTVVSAEREVSKGTKFSGYMKLPPGGENYREVLLTTPVGESRPPKMFVEHTEGSARPWKVRFEGETEHSQSFKTESEANAYVETFAPHIANEVVGGFKVPSAHSYGDPAADVNRFAHMFLDDRWINGKKYLTNWELQSDWSREGREKGYGKQEKYAVFSKESAVGEFSSRKEAEAALKAAGGEGEIQDLSRQGVPPFPFTKNWMEVALKKMLRMAAEEGYDGVAWATGDMVKDRYDLSKQVDEINVSRIKGDQVRLTVLKDGQILFDEWAHEKELPDLIGKDLAAKITADPKLTEVGGSNRYSGLDLKVGGEWANRQYDQMMPQFLGKYGKQWGAKVGEGGISGKPSEHELSIEESAGGGFGIYDRTEPMDMPLAEFDTRIAAQDYINSLDEITDTIHTLPFTPEMKESVLYEGQRLYAFSGIPDPQWIAQAARNFIKSGRAAGSMFKQIIESVKDEFGKTGAVETKMHLERMMGLRHEAEWRTEAGLMPYKELLDSMPRDQQMLEAAKYQIGGVSAARPDLQPLFQVTKDMNEQMWKKIHEMALQNKEEGLAGGRDLGYVENYLRQGMLENYKDPDFQDNKARFFEKKPFKNYLDLDKEGNPSWYQMEEDENGRRKYFKLESVGAGEDLRWPSGEPVQGNFRRGRSITGGRAFFKHKVFTDWSEALMVGGRPSMGLYDMVRADLSSKNHYLYGMEAWNQSRRSREIKYYTPGMQPEGYQPINDPMGRVAVAYMGPAPEGHTGGLDLGTLDRRGFDQVEPGYDMTAEPERIQAKVKHMLAYAPDPVAKVWNNFLSEGLKGRAWYDAYRSVYDPQRKFRVGFSTFHGKNVLNNDIAMGVGEHGSRALGALLGGDTEGLSRHLKEFGKAISGWKTAKYVREIAKADPEGSVMHRYLQEVLNPGDHPELRAEIDEFIASGGKLPPPEVLKPLSRAMADGMKSAAAELGDAHLFRAMSKFADTTSIPIMEYMVPAAKFLNFLERRRLALPEFERQWEGRSGAEKEFAWANELRNITRLNDAMYGQLSYDNLHISNMAKDLLHFVIQFPGWNIGSGRWMWANLKGSKQAIQSYMTGKGNVGSFERKAIQYTAGLVFKTAMFNGLLYYMLHGTTPDDPKELITKGVWTGDYHPDGSKQYIRDADYMRDIVGVIKHPLDTLAGKMPGLPRTAWELIANEDHFGGKVYTPGMPERWAGEIGKHIGSAFIPFSVQQINKGAGTLGKFGGFAGLTMTPAQMSRTEAEDKISDYYRNHAPRGATPYEREQTRRRTELVIAGKSGDRTGFEAGLADMRRDGTLSRAQEKRMREQVKDVRKQRFQHLPLETALSVFQSATDEEKKFYKPLLRMKVYSAAPETRRRLQMDIKDAMH